MSHNKSVLALGFFDGIHIGHGALLQKTRERAVQLGAEPAVLTFDNHPDTYVRGERTELISSADDRVYIIRRYYGIERVFFLHFNRSTMRLPWRTFLDRVIENYGAVHFVVGHDFRFGWRGEGNAALLADYCRENGLGCDVIPPVTLGGVLVSSTYIRSLVAEGEMERAMAFLGHPYLITDSVRTGFRIGHSIEAPTINMLLGEGVLVPRRGVYATKAMLPDGEHLAVTNVGTRPTFNGERVTVETNILDYDANLYGQTVCVAFYKFLRPERRFASPEELMEQIHRDAECSRVVLGG